MDSQFNNSNSNANMSSATNMHMNMAQNTKSNSEREQTREFGSGGGDFSFDINIKKTADDIYRTPRSQAYLDIVTSLDLLSATDEEIIEKLREVVDEDTLEEFSEMSVEELLEELRLSFEEEMLSRELEMKDFPEPEILLSVISKCYISGCDVHSIDHTGNILTHYTANKPMPEGMEIGRKMYYAHGGNDDKCRCVEIYNNCCRVIASDGTVSKYDLDGNSMD